MRNKPYLLTPQAKKSLRAAKQWSKSRWGDELTRKYFEDLDKNARYIAKNHPSLTGRKTITGAPELGIYPVREHYLIYTVLEKNTW